MHKKFLFRLKGIKVLFGFFGLKNELNPHKLMESDIDCACKPLFFPSLEVNLQG